MKRSWLLLAMALPFLMSPLAADSALPKTLFDMEILAQDDPKSLPRISAVLESYGEGAIPHSALLLAAVADTASPEDENPAYVKQLPRLVSEAKRNQFWPEYLRLKAIQLSLEKTEATGFAEDVQNLINEAAELGVKRLSYVFLTEFADQLFRRGNEIAASRLFSEASKVIYFPDLSDFDRAMMKNRLAIYLDWKRQPDRAQQLYEDAYQLAAKLKIRQLQIAIGYNLGRLFADQKVPALAQKSLRFFQESRQLASRMGDDVSVACNELGLAMAYLVLNRLTDGKSHAERAATIFKRLQDEPWLSTTHLILGRLLTQEGHHAQAAQHFEKSLELVNPSTGSQIILAETELGESYAALKSWEQAYRHLAKARLESDKLTQQLTQKQFAEESAKIGLSILTNDLQVKELEIKSQRERIYYVLAISIVSTLSFLSVSWLFFRLRTKTMKIQELQTYIQKSVLTRFLPPLIVEEIIQGRSRIESKPREEIITVLFSDIVNFTRLSALLGANEMSSLLNLFMTRMTEVINAHQGTVDKFIGDSVMVIFGAPLPLAERIQAQTAVACAKDMLATLRDINELTQAKYGIQLSIRVGINQGPAIVGIFGSEKRSDYTAIGPTVNIASRIEGKADANEIWVSQELVQYLDSSEYVPMGLHRLKGIDQDFTLFAIRV